MQVVPKSPPKKPKGRPPKDRPVGWSLPPDALSRTDVLEFTAKLRQLGLKAGSLNAHSQTTTATAQIEDAQGQIAHIKTKAEKAEFERQLEAAQNSI